LRENRDGQEKDSYKPLGGTILNRVEIAMKLPSLNDYIRVCRSNRYKSSKMKKNIEQDIGMFIGRLPKFRKPVKIHFHWVESDRRRDLDNIAFAKKFILDALVKYGKLNDDSSKWVTGFTDTFEYSDETKVIICIEEDK
jgi:Holliday junction resolvase RusA-like endonuclease